MSIKANPGVIREKPFISRGKSAKNYDRNITKCVRKSI